MIEYAHSQRNLLGVQVDAPLNNGVWGGPVLNTRGQVVGMALQKFSTQTWWERYDAELGGGRWVHKKRGKLCIICKWSSAPTCWSLP